MKGRFHQLLLSLIVLGLSATASAKTEEVNLSVGEEYVVDNLKEYAVENPQILGTSPGRDNKSKTFRGLRSGNTKVILRETTGETRTLDVTVAARDPKLVLQELDGLLRNYTDVGLRINRNLVVLEGAVKTEREFAQLKEIEKRYEGQISNLVTVGPSGQRRNVMVRLDIHYVQVRRSLGRKLGVQYPGSVSLGSILQATSVLPLTAVMGSSMPQTQQGLISSLLPSLDINETNGYIRVKRADTLITENGAKAVYRDGSEVMIKLPGTFAGGTVEKIFYGAELTMTPRLSASNDSVSLEISSDITQRDNIHGIDGLPAKIIEQLQTSIHVPLGQSAMLAAADSRSELRSTSGLPWLNRIPVLGYLFGSETKEADSSYGVIYITPTLVQGTSGVPSAQIEQALKFFEKPGLLPR
jgi:pilus assembly protein CpaC